MPILLTTYTLMPTKLVLGLLFMRSIAVWLLFREATTAELRVLSRLDEISFSIDHIHGSGNSDGTALWIDENLWISHGVTPVLIEVIAQ